MGQINNREYRSYPPVYIRVIRGQKKSQQKHSGSRDEDAAPAVHALQYSFDTLNRTPLASAMRPLRPQSVFSLRRLAQSVLGFSLLGVAIFVVSVAGYSIYAEYFEWAKELWQTDGFAAMVRTVSEDMKGRSGNLLGEI
jgi:hypothetical protein